jgi:thiamine kinase-like enzyme
MIPENKKSAVTLALQTAFGVSEYDEITELTQGLSTALIFRIVVNGRPYLLRIITRTDNMGGPSQYYNGMKTAAEAGLAPQIRYVHVEDRIYITDFINAKPFPLDEARVLMPALLRRLHALPLFSSRIYYLDFVDSQVRKFLSANIISDAAQKELLDQYERIFAVYPRNQEEMVSCHNDLKPDNILFDGKRVWLVDWEAAFPNDRYVELAAVGNFVLTSEEHEKEYLKIYFGQDASDYQRARFFLMQQLIYLIYGCYFMLLAAKDGNAVDLQSAIPEFRTFHDRVWKGELYLLDKTIQAQYARVHLERVRQNLQLERFEESLKLVSDRSLKEKV